MGEEEGGWHAPGIKLRSLRGVQGSL